MALMTLKLTTRQQYLRLHRGLSELLYRHDPVGLAAAGAPNGEYEAEAGTIIPRLKDANSSDDVRRIVHQEFLRWFNNPQTAGPESAYNGIAKKSGTNS
jgi:hypothetical protein